MTTLINPANNQPCEFVASERGYVALRLTCTVTPAIQWFTLAAIERVNPVYGCAIPQNFDSGMAYIYPQPYVQPLILALPADMLGTVGGGRGKNKRATVAGVNAAESLHVIVIKPVTLWHESMAA